MLRFSLFAVSMVIAAGAFVAQADGNDVNTPPDNKTWTHKGKKKNKDAKPDQKVTAPAPVAEKPSPEPAGEDIRSDTTALASEANASWKRECDKWKADLKKEHGTNVMNINCGSPVCSGDVGEKSCVSKGTYTVKTKD